MGAGDSGDYFLAEQKVLGRDKSTAGGAALFFRGGIANSRINKFDYHVSAGGVYTGPFSGREDDILGIALAHVHSGSEFRQLRVKEGRDVLTGEFSFEFTYRASLTSWLALQFDMQHIVHPGIEPAVNIATVLGGRMEVTF